MRRKIAITMLVTIFTFFSIGFNSYATKLEEQKKSVEKEKSQSQENLNQIQSEKKSVQQEVDSLNDSINEVQSELSDLEDEIEKLEESIKEKEDELEAKQKLLDERLSYVYMNDSNPYLDILFKDGIVKFISNYDMLTQIAEYDNNLINKVKEVKSELEADKEKLEESKAEIEVKKSDLEDKKKEREEKVKDLSADEQAEQTKIQEKEAELSKINNQIKEEQKKIEEERKKAQTKSETTSSRNNTTSSSSSSSSSSGTSSSSSGISSSSNNSSSSSASMSWPTQITRRVNSIYAPNGRDDTVGYYGTKHKGVDIYAPTGTPIYAAQSGTVVYVNYSGYGGGWGLYVVIYHGTDSSGRAVYTRYAHANSIASGISVGTKVTTGTVIMYAGSTGAAEGAHLHFEVCLNNMYNQVNPCPYLGISNSTGYK